MKVIFQKLSFEQIGYVGVRKFIAIRIDERHEEPIDVIDVLRMSFVVFHQFTYDVSHSVFK